jgi:hypothetical protein
MGSSKLKDLKAFVRYDGSGRVVAGSLVFRKNKPKNGRWVEIPKSLCCNNVPTLLTDTIPGEYPLNYVSIRIFCGESTAATAYTSLTAADMSELIILLNTDEGTRAFGTYSAIDEITVQLSVPTSVKNNLCPDGVLSFNIFED